MCTFSTNKNELDPWKRTGGNLFEGSTEQILTKRKRKRK